MMPGINEIIARKPHLKEILEAYEKVRKFRDEAEAFAQGYTVNPHDVCYPPELIDPLLGSYSSSFGIPPEILSPLSEAMKLHQVDLTRLPFRETPAFSLPYHEDELSMHLFLISKPFFIWSRAKLNHGSLFWEEGRCPVCHGEPALSFTRKEWWRAFSCSYCEAKGAWHRVGCPLCQNRDGKYLEIIEAEQEEGFRLTVCRKCKGYVKMIDESLLEFYGEPDLLDIISIPLDIVAQNQGLQRHAPNPLGMTRIS